MAHHEIVEQNCPICGRIFIPAYLHDWKTTAGCVKEYCSYTCMRKAEREIEAMEAAKRRMAAVKRSKTIASKLHAKAEGVLS